MNDKDVDINFLRKHRELYEKILSCNSIDEAILLLIKIHLIEKLEESSQKNKIPDLDYFWYCQGCEKFTYRNRLETIMIENKPHVPFDCPGCEAMQFYPEKSLEDMGQKWVKA